MKREDLLKRAADWSGETWAGRIDQCASMLFCHGYLSMNQRERIGRMLEAECTLALAAATGTAKTPTAAECEASQSGPQGNAQTPSPKGHSHNG